MRYSTISAAVHDGRRSSSGVTRGVPDPDDRLAVDGNVRVLVGSEVVRVEVVAVTSVVCFNESVSVRGEIHRVVVVGDRHSVDGHGRIAVRVLRLSRHRGLALRRVSIRLTRRSVDYPKLAHAESPEVSKSTEDDLN